MVIIWPVSTPIASSSHPVAPEVAHDAPRARRGPGCAGSAARGTAARRGRRCRCRSRRSGPSAAGRSASACVRTTAVKRSSRLGARRRRADRVRACAIVAATSSGSAPRTRSDRAGRRTIDVGEQAHPHLADRLGRRPVVAVVGEPCRLLRHAHVHACAPRCADRGQRVLAGRIEDRRRRGSVPRWLVCPMRPFADAIVASTRISPAKSHAPYMPRCTRSQRSSSNSRNICLPTARASVAVRPSMIGGALGESALRARRRAPRARRSCGRTGGRCDGRNGPRASPASGSNELSSAASTSGAASTRIGSMRPSSRTRRAARCGGRGARRRENGVGDEGVDEASRLLERCAGARRSRSRWRRCARGRARAVAMLQTSAARMPRTLFAAICSPLPEPPKTTPSVSMPAAWSRDDGLRGVDAERRVVVERVVARSGRGRRPRARCRSGGAELASAELEAGVVGRDVDAHAPSLGIRHRQRDAAARASCAHVALQHRRRASTRSMRSFSERRAAERRARRRRCRSDAATERPVGARRSARRRDALRRVPAGSGSAIAAAWIAAVSSSAGDRRSTLGDRDHHRPAAMPALTGADAGSILHRTSS